MFYLKSQLPHRIFKSWWVILFVLFCFMLYEQGIRQVNGQYKFLKKQLDALENEKEDALAKQNDLLLQINSHSDPAWIELTLMKGLGLVPEGQTKIYFKK